MIYPEVSTLLKLLLGEIMKADGNPILLLLRTACANNYMKQHQQHEYNVPLRLTTKEKMRTSKLTLKLVAQPCHLAKQILLAGGGFFRLRLPHICITTDQGQLTLQLLHAITKS